MDGYQVEVDTFDSRRWHEHVTTFDDANLYQLWQQGTAGRFSEVSRLVLKKFDSVVAAAEVRLFTLPLTRRGIAYVRWGPLWRNSSTAPNTEHFQQAVRALKNEYAHRRGMVIRVNPRVFLEENQHLTSILTEEGFGPLEGGSVERTLVCDLSPDVNVLRQRLLPKWRNCLNKAERSGLTIVAGTEIELFDEFETLYKQMLKRKGFVPTADLHKHRQLQSQLPERLKMRVVIARLGEKACAGGIVSAMGDTALYLFGATNEEGMRVCGSYLVQWDILSNLKANGIREYDLHGINPEANAGTYHFKKGVAGSTGREVTFVGQIQSFEPSFSNYSLLFMDRLRQSRRAPAPAAAGAAAAAGGPSG